MIIGDILRVEIVGDLLPKTKNCVRDKKTETGESEWDQSQELKKIGQ